ncbi:MAG: DNA recombination protein RmuC [Candidatus Thalassarchaeaceae archaeon]
MEALGLAYVAVGLVIGGVIGWLLAKQKMGSEIIRYEERIRANEGVFETNENRMKAEIENMVIKAGERNTAQFLKLAEQRFSSDMKEAENALESRKMEVENLIKPLRIEMEKMSVANQEIEKERVGAYQAIKRQIKDLGDKTDSLGDRTTALSTALTTSGQARGNWGEVKLRRLFEMAGLSEQVDFFEQETIQGGGRPDYIVRLPQQGVIPIDSKATGAHFLRAVELESGSDQDALLIEHSKAMKNRIKELGAKDYQGSIEGDFDHVIMFIPSEAMAAAAFTTDPELLDYAMSKSVLIATPVTMLGLLRTVALYWQQHSLAEGAREIYDVSREMYKRINTLIDHFMKVGGHLDKAGRSYNEAMSSYERRVLPQGRRLDELRVSETLQTGLPDPKEIEVRPAGAEDD